jgi:integrase
VAKRRTSGDGGLTKKTGYYTDADGQRIAYTYWQASREVPADDVPKGMTRKRVTGNGSSRAEALARLKANYDKFESGESTRGAARLSQRATVKALFAEWDRHNWAGAVSETMAWKYQRYFENHILPHIGDRRLGSLRETDLLHLFTVILPAKKDAKGGPLLGGPARRNIYMALSGCLNFGVRTHVIPVNPLEGVKPPRKEAPKDDIDRVMADGRRVLAAIQTGDHPDEARWLLAFLGLRRGERLGLSWANVRGLDGDQPRLVIDQQLAWDKGPGLHIKPATKNKKPRTIPLAEPWVSALRRHRQRWEAMTTAPGFAFKKPEYADLVFLQPNGNVIHPNDDNDHWRALLTGLGMEPWRGHLTRHVTAILLAERPDIPISVVMAVLGHETEAMSVYYAHVDQVRVRPPIEDYGRLIALEGTQGPPGPPKRRATRRPSPIR